MKKIFLTVLMLLLIMAVSSKLINKYGEAVSNKNIEEMYNTYQVGKFIDNISFKDNSKDSVFYLSDTIELQYKWSTVDQKKGDSLVYTIPKEMYIANDIEFSLLTTSGTEIGEVKLSSKENKMNVVFSDPSNLLGKNNLFEGFFYFTVKLTPELWKENFKQVVNFPIGDKIEKLTVSIQKEETASSDELLYSWGMYNKIEKLIDWDVRMNYAEEDLYNVSLRIDLQGKENIILNSFEIFELKEDKLIKSQKEILIESDVDDIVVIIEHIDKPYIISFKSQSIDEQLSVTLKSYTTTLAEVDGINAFFTAGSSIFNKVNEY